jgi:hypothetical protein
MSIKNFIPTIWTETILRTNEDNLIAKKICNTSYSGTIKNAGDTIKFNGMSDPTVNPYTGTVNYEDLGDSSVILKVDQQNYFAFQVSDIDEAQANVDLKNSQAKRASYQLAKTCDNYILGSGTYGVVPAGNTVTATITSANIIFNLSKMKQKLEEQNVTDKDTFIVVPPWVKQKLLMAGIKFQINNGINGTGGMSWTDELGYDVYITNQVANTGTASVPVSQILAGSYNAMVYAEQILETEAIRLQTSFSDAIRGLHVFGHKVVKPNELALGVFTYADETTI